tara:strand:+ start:1153 stop:1494 length:342 start_codon:yes stop_codon:yes gene_type:complete
MNQMALIEMPKAAAPFIPPAGYYLDRHGMRELVQPIIPGVVSGIMRALKRGAAGRQELHRAACPYICSHTLGKHLGMLIQTGFVTETHNFNAQLWEEPALYSLAGANIKENAL